MAIPHEPYFFQPLLPGFHNGVKIPLVFFSKHIEGKTNQKTWKLRTDASDQTWEVIQEGRKLTGGSKDFTTEYDLRVGDIVIFKHEGDMVFHVIPFCPSCCEIQYVDPSDLIKEEADADDAAEDTAGDVFDVLAQKTCEMFLTWKIVSYISGGTWEMSSFSFDYSFLAKVKASNLKHDKLHLPVGATSSTALNKQGQEMILVNKQRNSWTVSLRFSDSGGMNYITRGWRKFCLDNRCDIGDSFVFNMVGDGKTTPLFCVCLESKESSSAGHIASSSRVN